MSLLPTTAYSEYTLSSNQPTLKTESVSGKSISRHVNGHQWEININFPVLTAAEFTDIYGFLVDKSTYKTFTLTLPDRDPRGVATGAPRISNQSGYAKGSTTLLVDGFTANTTDILKAGDLLKCSHNKVYTNLTDVSTNPDDALLRADDSGGLLLNTGDRILMSRANQTTLTIAPPLMEAIADNEVITVSSVPFTVLCTKQIEESVKAPILYDFNFDVIEAR